MSGSEEQTQALEEFKLRREKERTKLGEFLVPHPPLYNNWHVCVCVSRARDGVEAAGPPAGDAETDSGLGAGEREDRLPDCTQTQGGGGT